MPFDIAKSPCQSILPLFYTPTVPHCICAYIRLFIYLFFINKDVYSFWKLSAALIVLEDI